MILRNEGLFWVGLGVFVLTLLVLLSEILFPFVAGIAVAYFFNPAVVTAGKFGLGRAVSASLVLAFFVVSIVLIGLLIFPILQGQIVALFAQLPLILEEGILRLSELTSENMHSDLMANTELGEEALLGAVPRLADWAFQSVQTIWQSGSALINFVGLLFITPVVAWYLLRDWEKIVSKCDDWLPREHTQTIRHQLHLIDGILANYCRGQASVCIILAIAYSVALGILGLKYGLVVGLVAGIISFVPYVGTIVGFFLAGGLAYFQFGGVEFVGIVAIVFVMGQVIEGYILTPKLVGRRIGLNAVWLLFALLAGGALFGLVGILLAVPVAAIIGVGLRFLFNHYLQSSLYHGSTKNMPGPEK